MRHEINILKNLLRHGYNLCIYPGGFVRGTRDAYSPYAVLEVKVLLWLISLKYLQYLYMYFRTKVYWHLMRYTIIPHGYRQYYKNWKYRVFRKKTHDSLLPLPRLHRCEKSSKLSTQCECTVTPIGWLFFVQPIAAECWRGRGGKLLRILEKKTIFNEHPVHTLMSEMQTLAPLANNCSAKALPRPPADPTQ